MNLIIYAAAMPIRRRVLVEKLDMPEKSYYNRMVLMLTVSMVMFPEFPVVYVI